ncbi:MAG: hypothetical protein R3F59_06550 [Myxococcota bacterium]
MEPALRTLMFWFVAIGCGRGGPPAPAVDARTSTLALARGREVPSPVQARFSISLQTAAKKFPTTGGALILDRPRGHLAVLGPLGGPLATLQTDGEGAAVNLMRDERHLLAARADDVLRANTHGAIGVDALLGVLEGDVPLDDAPVRSERPGDDGTVQVVLDGPDGTALSVILDAARGTPVSMVAWDVDGTALLEASYEPFEALPGSPEAAPVWVPSAVTLRLPALDLLAELKYRSWQVPEADSPALASEVFGLAPPPGFSSQPLEDVAVGLFAGLLPPPE